jgi:hypothetical protein
MDPSVELAFLLHFCPLPPLALAREAPLPKEKCTNVPKAAVNFGPRERLRRLPGGFPAGARRLVPRGESIPVRSELTIYPPGR